MPNLGHIFGKLKDGAGKPVEGASVLVLQTKFDSAIKKSKAILIKGALTGSNGEFDFEALPVMGVKIKISATGFKRVANAHTVPGSLEKCRSQANRRQAAPCQVRLQCLLLIKTLETLS